MLNYTWNGHIFIEYSWWLSEFFHEILNILELTLEIAISTCRNEGMGMLTTLEQSSNIIFLVRSHCRAAQNAIFQTTVYKFLVEVVIVLSVVTPKVTASASYQMSKIAFYSLRLPQTGYTCVRIASTITRNSNL